MLRAACSTACACLIAALAVAGDAPAAPPAAAPISAEARLLAAARAVDYEYQRRVNLLYQDVASADPAVRLHAARALRDLQEPDAVPRLLPLLDAGTHSVDEVAALCQILADLEATAATGALQRLLTHPDASLRLAARNGLAQLRALQTGDHMRLARDSDADIRGSAETDLGTIGHAEAAAILAKALQDESDPHLRRMAAIGLGRLGDANNGPALADALCDPDPGVRRYAAEGIVRCKYGAAVPNLLMALEGDVAAAHIDRCLRLLTGQDFGFDARADLVARQAAIEKGFQWWAANAKTFQPQ